jgi:magnesium chelatase family protein
LGEVLLRRAGGGRRRPGDLFWPLAIPPPWGGWGRSCTHDRRPALCTRRQCPSPGDASLAHHDVHFLDELSEFRRDALEALRRPLEGGIVTLARATATFTYPARFTLVAAMNPCPCDR